MPESRCRKCHRLLKAASSIALGIGPTCAGTSGGRGRKIGIKVQQKSGDPYSFVQAGEKVITLPLPLFIEDEDIFICLRAASEPMPFDELLQLARNVKRRKLIRKLRRERYENRLSLAPGMYTRPGWDPIIYEPVGNQEWKCSTSEHLISHESLGKYLLRYGRI